MTLPLQCIVAHNNYGLYCVPERSKQRPASIEIINGRIWEPETISLICRFAGSGDIIHAGTFFGDFLPAISRALVPSAKLWAFEPNSENFQAAAITCRLNDLSNVELHPCGLSERGDRLSLRIGQGGTWFGGGSHILGREGTLGEDIEEATVVPIDSLIPPHRQISVLQLDVEGHERAALAGGHDLIRRWRPLLILETLPKDWGETLEPLGYRLVGRCHDNSVLAASEVKI